MINELILRDNKELSRSLFFEFVVSKERWNSTAKDAKDQMKSMLDGYMKLINPALESSEDDDSKRENANIDANSPMGTMLSIGSLACKNTLLNSYWYFYKNYGDEFTTKYLLDSKHMMMHELGEIHIHDMNFYSITFNCCQIPLGKLLSNGFSTGHGYIRTPNSILSAASLACIVLQSNQNDMFGGQSIPTFEYDLAPYVVKTFTNHLNDYLAFTLSDIKYTYKEYIEQLVNEYYGFNGQVLTTEILDELSDNITKRTYIEKCLVDKAINKALQKTTKDTYQAMEALLHNLNTMQSRAGAQVPFSSINYGTGTKAEQRMIIKAILEATDAGLGNGETPIFPVQVFKYKKGINTKKGEPNYDLFLLSCKVSAKRLFPNYVFLDSSFNLPYYDPKNPATEIAVMGCRTRVIGNIHGPEIVSGRGNIAFTTINLVRLALTIRQCNQDLFLHNNHELLFNKLRGKIKVVFEEVAEQLVNRYQVLCNKKKKHFPFVLGQNVYLGSDLLDDEDNISDILKQGSLSIGFIGLAETLKVLTGFHHGENMHSQAMGLDIVRFMRKLTDWFTEKYNLNFSLFATPAEGLSGRFVKMDRQVFGVIEGVTDKDYYTNSFHVPVYYNIPAYKKLAIEGKYHKLCNAGAITYIEVDGNIGKNIPAFEKLIHAMSENDIGYGSINHPVDRCPVCGFTGVIDEVCPKCGRKDGEGVSIEKLNKLGCNYKCS